MRHITILKTSALLLASTLLAGTVTVNAQEQESVILKAMKDEMKRTLAEAQYEGHDKPFYISYGITDLNVFTANATLGGLVRSDVFRDRNKSVRLLVGNYVFNDESLDNNLTSPPNANDLQVPLDDDYFGIRRALWASTDVVYKGAAQKYKKHQSTLKEENKKLADMPHREFATVPVVTLLEQPKPYALDKEKWNHYCKELSALFKAYPVIENSAVAMSFTYGEEYFVNSEGTTIVKPLTIAFLQCGAIMKTEKGEPLFDNLVRYARTPEGLPSLADMKAQVNAMAKKLTTSKDNPVLEEDYNGPVLFQGTAVAEAFLSALFAYRENLTASNTLASTMDYRSESNGSLDSKIGKPVVDNTLTVTARTRLKTYNNIPLIGAYEVDDEGVVPQDDLVLVEKGILKNQLNDRSLTKTGQMANGHASGPGVVEVSVEKGSAVQAMKQQLIASAKKEGLSFAIIVRKIAPGGDGISEVYKVNLETGTETLLRSARLSSLGLKNLKRVAATGKEKQVITLQTGGNNLVSYIVPDALLLDNMDIAPLRIPYQEEDKDYIPSPLN
ncbi:metallopeptidase TldD-related protein [Chryseolinea lacunae]|uniref:Metalloprotease TldD/E C-terminal domain-containing protein n=1 Tax=Chryseolinea lacunae TaxID=2801331 RepID=A0ABS1KTF3_9BACT|nr:metallopeptidase TldD-related protein [Chryseolinea lacunae]MBL0742497.1 hypothetical protein [Chryseolinea lacunae]